MDFEYHYTGAGAVQAEVRTWLEENIPPEIKAPVDPEDLSDELYNYALELRRKLGEKGWLYPNFPKEYGGGGLTQEHEVIIQEELRKRKIPTVRSNELVLPAIFVWGTEEQRKKFLPGLLTGETIAFQNFTEPQSGSDLANIRSRAVRDGDDWILNGEKVFVSGGGPGRADLLFGPFMTDPEAPRHNNLGYFLIEAPTQGLTLTSLQLLNGRNQHFVVMDNVRVPGENLLGGDHQGWQVTQTTLEQEHGGRGQALPLDEAVDDLIDYVRDTKQNGGRLGEDPFIRQQVVRNYIDAHTYSLFAMRNYSMYQGREEMSYHGSQLSAWRKEYGLRNSGRARDVMGLYSVLSGKDQRSPFEGRPEVYQRFSLCAVHPGGTLEIQKLIIARRLGVSKTQERAAPTPSTATKFTA